MDESNELQNVPISTGRRHQEKKKQFSGIALCMGAERKTCEEVQEEAAAFAEKAIREGKGVIDPGATDSIGGYEAIERVALLNLDQYGDTQVLNMDLEHKPWYTLGNADSE